MKKRPERAIGDLLRAADPLLDDEGLSEDDVARMRRRVIAEVRPQEPRWRFAPVLAAAALILLALHAGFTFLETPNHTTDPVEVAAVQDPSLSSAGEETAQRQQIQFVTSNGTRVIWVLTSDLDL